MTLPEADAIARATLSCPGVVRLANGAGVFETGPTVEVHVVARDGRPLPQLADEIRRTVAPLAGARPVDVVIVDIEPDLPPVGPVDLTATT